MNDASQPNRETSLAQAETISIDLRDPWLAAFLAWLVPGLGHMYQRRWGKGGLFMTCIMGTFFYGLWLGGGRVVYASFREGDVHYAYLCQVGAGLPALPAVVQAMRVGGPNPKAPLFDGLMAPPMMRMQVVPRDWAESQAAKNPGDPQFARFIPYNSDERDPLNRVYVRYLPVQDSTDQLGQLHYKYGAYFDLGTVFTMIAGLLNILAIWDAFAGPATPAVEVEEEGEEESTQRKKD
jgi:hypothetical protein